ncbi:MAG TPA: hypothetical protein VHJ82_08425 [Actinomycetota bacterium]|nr:hypothetical protein [Actinomycetota bacterium]
MIRLKDLALAARLLAAVVILPLLLLGGAFIPHAPVALPIATGLFWLWIEIREWTDGADNERAGIDILEAGVTREP